MKDKILEKRRKRAALVKEARSIHEAALEEEREFTAEEREKYEAIMADVDKLGEEIEREERLAALTDDLETRDQAAIRPEPGAGNDGEDRTGVLSREYRDAWFKAFRRGVSALSPEEYRALQVGTDSEGGYLTPTDTANLLIQALQEQNIMRSLCNVQQVDHDREVPVVSSHGQAYWTAEEAAYTESDEAFSQVTFGAYKATTLMKVSEELLYDSLFDLESYIAAEYARRRGDLEETAFVAGDGSGKPTGVITSAGTGVTAASATAITADELLELYHSLGRPYRRNAVFLAKDSTILAIRKLKDSNGQYIWQPGLQGGEPDRLLGRPFYASSDMPAMTTGNKSVVFFDPSYYWILDRGQPTFQILRELYAVNGQVGFRSYNRVDGKLTLAAAAKVLVQA